MTDILDHLQPDSPLYEATREAAREEIERLRLQLKGMANVIDDLVMAIELPGDHCETHIALCAAKAALTKYRGEE